MRPRSASRPGPPWNPADLDPATRKAIKAGIADARAEFKRRGEAPYDAADFFNTRENVSSYMDRVMGVYLGIFGNTTDQSIYLTEGTATPSLLTTSSFG